MKGLYKRKILLVALIFALLLTGCSSQFENKRSGNPQDEMMATEAQVAEVADALKNKEAAKEEGNAPENGAKVYQTATDTKEKIVYKFHYSLETKNLNVTEDRLNKIIKDTGSYISDVNVRTASYGKSADYTVRVPKQKSEDFQKAIAETANVISQTMTSENYTNRYRDLETDKITSDIKEEKLQALLKKAETFEDIMKIETELANIGAKKVQTAKELSDIDLDVDYQYFNISIREVKEPSKPVTEKITFGDKIERNFNKSIESAKALGEGLILLVVRFWIFFLVMAIVAVVLIRVIKKDIRKKKERKEKEKLDI